MNVKRKGKKPSENNNQLTNSEEIIQCLICWEPENKENKIFKMKHINLFTSDCSCDCNFHLFCFFDWVKKTPTCPICREELSFNEENFHLHTLGPHYKIKLFFKNVYNWINDFIKIIIKYMAILFLLQVSINVIISILRKHEASI